MKFCPECNNLLMSKKGKIFCKTCEKIFEVKPNEKNDYMLIKKIDHDDSDFNPFILKNVNQKPLATDYRKAYEDYFSSSE